jgi:eukaryotic-like serine/threonine-protein kinase
VSRAPSKTSLCVLAPNLRVGDKYRLIRRLGRGGMGEVWLARNEATGAQVALKALNADVSVREDTLDRFRREAQLGGLLSHRHIVQIFDLVEDPSGTMVLVMEFLRGETLDAYFARVGPLTTREAISIVLPILSALQHAHDAGVIHRDVTPANVFLAVDSDGHVIPKLVDFGIAKHVGGEFHTVAGEVLGTPSYMAPEIIRGARDFDGTSDLFSVGILLYELITGAGPFHESTPAAALAAVLEKTVDPDERIEPRVWVELSRVLAKRSYERHPNARELASALALALSDTRSQARTRDVNVALRRPPLVPDIDDEWPSARNRAMTGAATTNTQPTSIDMASRERRTAVKWTFIGAAIAATLVMASVATTQLRPSARDGAAQKEVSPTDLSAASVNANPESSVIAQGTRPAISLAMTSAARTDAEAELPPRPAASHLRATKGASPRAGSGAPSKKPVARSPGF